MLLRLDINHFATFKKTSMDFHSGFNILSGESGAGKSVILKALELCFGGRISKKLLHESKNTEICALFKLEKPLQIKWSDTLDLEGDELLIRRRMSRDGRNTVEINDRLSTTRRLAELGKDLCVSLSQDESLELKKPEYQLDLLDTWSRLGPEKNKYKEIYKDWLQVQSKIKELEEQERVWKEERDFQAFRLEELNRVNLKKGELEELSQQHKNLAHRDEVQHHQNSIDLSGADFIKSLDLGLPSLAEFSSAESQLGKLCAEGRDLQASLEEWLRALQGEKEDMNQEPVNIEEIEGRLGLLHGLLKKFNLDEEGLISLREDLKNKLEGASLEVELKKLNKESALIKKSALLSAEKLHKTRLTKSKKLISSINANLEQLEMSGGRFNIHLEKHETLSLGPDGISQIDFQLRTGENQPWFPLHGVASGGERSRAMLAICSSMSEQISPPLLILDEIDTNIGSRLGSPVSKCMSELAKSHQILCVTHLAPVAAGKGHHFLVEKKASSSSIRLLDTKERVAELSQMIAGEKNSPWAEKQAKEMLKQA